MLWLVEITLFLSSHFLHIFVSCLLRMQYLDCRKLHTVHINDLISNVQEGQRKGMKRKGKKSICGNTNTHSV